MQEIIDKARDSLSEFCSSECKAYCCRSSYLVIKKYHFDLLSKKQLDFLYDNNLLIPLEDNTFSINMSKDCPFLKDFKCSIYQKRPQMCKDFPIFSKGKIVVLSKRCLAVQQNKLYPFVKELLDLGCRIIESDADPDIYF